MSDRTMLVRDGGTKLPLLFKDNGDGTFSLAVDIGGATVTVEAGDLQIGAIEIKDHDTDTRVKVKSDGVDNAVVVTQNSSPLPTGGATSAAQSDANDKLDNVNTTLAEISSDTDRLTQIESNTDNLPPLGQTVKAASVPVVIASDQDAIPVAPAKSSTANIPSIITSAGNALTANATRKSWSIQNLGLYPLFVRLGANASSTVFHRVLKGGSSNDDGLGGSFEDDVWTGIVSVAGSSPRFAVTEIA